METKVQKPFNKGDQIEDKKLLDKVNQTESKEAFDKADQIKIIKEPLYKNGCWGCKRAWENPKKEYVCPKLEEHWKEYKSWITKN